MTAQERIDKIVATIQARVDSFNEAVPDVEKRVYNKLLSMLKDLKVVNGRIVNGVENINRISKIIPEIEKIIVDAGYEKKVAGFSQAFDEVANLQNNYFSSLNVQFTPKKVLTRLLEVNKKWTVEKLTQRGISADFSPAMRDILDRAMTSGAEYSDLTEQIRNYVLSGEAGPGALARYSRQVATDSLNFFSANYNETITADLGLKWRVYTGSLLETSREWCVHMVEKKYVHEAELNDVITKEIDGVEIGSEDIPVNKKTGLPRGMMEGTNADTVKSNRGGWQCGHQWAAVTENMVPLNIRIATYNKYGIGHNNGVANGKKVKPIAPPAPAPEPKPAKDPAPAPLNNEIKQKLPIPKFTAAEKKAIEDYTLSDYSVINPRLMGVVKLGLEEYQDNIEALDSVLLKSKTTEDITVSRYISSEGGSLGIGGFDAKALKGKVGETITHKGFLSTTIDAATIPAGEKQIVNIKLPKGSSALYLDPFSLNRGEEEILLARNSQIKILGFKEVNGKIIIDAELVGQKIQSKTAPKPTPAPAPAPAPAPRYQLTPGYTIQSLRADLKSAYEEVFEDDIDEQTLYFLKNLTEDRISDIDSEILEFLEIEGVVQRINVENPKAKVQKKVNSTKSEKVESTETSPSKFIGEVKKSSKEFKSNEIYQKTIAPLQKEMEARIKEGAIKVGKRTTEVKINNFKLKEEQYDVWIYGHGINRDYIEQISKKSPLMRPENLVRLTGFDPEDLDGTVLISHVLNRTWFKTEITLEDDSGVKMVRIIDWQNRTITNDLFTIEKDSKFKGKGSLIFERQVKFARLYGFNKIETYAARIDGSYNGYYTWPRLGYDMELPKRTRERIEQQLGIRVETLRELFSSIEGREWWKEKGDGAEMTFTLNDPNKGINQLFNYLNNKNK